MRLSVPLPAGAVIVPHEIRTDLALSPDGRHVAFVVTAEGRTQLWLRSLDASQPRALAGTDGASSPFWSPDSRFIGFAADGALKKVRCRWAGRPVSSAKARFEGVPSWGQDGTIVFSKSLDGIYRVSAEGGAATQVTRLDQSRGEVDHLWPHFLPDGRRFLFSSTSRVPEEQASRKHLRGIARWRPAAAAVPGGLAGGICPVLATYSSCAKGPWWLKPLMPGLYG